MGVNLDLLTDAVKLLAHAVSTAAKVIAPVPSALAAKITNAVEKEQPVLAKPAVVNLDQPTDAVKLQAHAVSTAAKATALVPSAPVVVKTNAVEKELPVLASEILDYNLDSIEL